MIRWFWATTSVLLAAGCSAGGSSDGEANVTPSTTTPGTLLPGDSVPSIPNTPGARGGGDVFGADELAPPDDCDEVIPVVYRDFDESHPDFEMPFSGDVVRRQLIAPTLGAGDKPVFASSVGCPAQPGTPMACADWDVQQPVITSAATFDQWYRDVPGVNQSFARDLSLTETAPGSGLYVYNSNDFFPLGPQEGFGVTPPNGQNKNFLFTTEIHLSFTYVSGQRFSFRGDDDLWIFINKRLALDLGSMHGQESGTIDFDAQAADLGIRPNGVYAMDIFHAERHTNASNFSIETNIACFTPTTVF